MDCILPLAVVQGMLESVRRAVARKSDNVALTMARLDVDQQHIRMTATNLLLSLEATYEIDSQNVRVTTPGSILFPFWLVSDIMATSADVPTRWYTNDQDHLVIEEQKQHGDRTNVSLGDEDNFPSIPWVDTAGQGLALLRDQVLQMIERLQQATDQTGTRPILAGCLIYGEGDSLVGAAADGRVAAEIVLRGAGHISDRQIIVPAQSCLDALQSIKGDKQTRIHMEQVQWRAPQSQYDDPQDLLMIRGSTTDNISLRACLRLLSGDFPPYRRIYQENPDHRYQITAKQLLAKLQRVELMAQKGGDISQAWVAAGASDYLCLMGQNETGSSIAYVDGICLSTSDDPTITAVQPQLTERAIRICNSDTVELQIWHADSKSSRPRNIQVVPVGGDDSQIWVSISPIVIKSAPPKALIDAANASRQQELDLVH